MSEPVTEPIEPPTRSDPIILAYLPVGTTPPVVTPIAASGADSGPAGPLDTGTQFAGLTPLETILAKSDPHMPYCDEPRWEDCTVCRVRIDVIRRHLAALFAACEGHETFVGLP